LTDVELLPGTGRDERDRHLTQHRVRMADDRRLADAGCGQQHPLDLRRADVLAPHLEHVLVAFDEPEEAVRVQADAIAGAEPAMLVEGRGGELGCVEVARE
jgi:hypothetical protein